MSSRRRNGQPASCEPCRKDKVRCDHERPVCGRCQQRDTASWCFYHPAPMTQKVESPAPRSKIQRKIHSGEEFSRKKVQRLSSPTPSSVEITIRSPEADQGLPSGYFGPTSFVSAFDENPVPTPSSSIDTSQLRGDEQLLSSSLLPSFWVPEITKLLSYMTEYSTIKQLVYEFYASSQAALIPSPFMLKSISEMRGIISDGETPRTLHKKTTQILENTAKRFQITTDTKGKDFHKLFTGERLRLEIIGTVYAVAARATFFGLAHDRFSLGSSGSTSAPRIKFARKMLAASDTALQVCRILTPVNDLLLWLLYENWQLSCTLLGDSSSTTWHRLGELSSYILELGLHRDCYKENEVPMFLREIRRRLFAGFYQLDKNFATFLGRPPRISWRYSDSKPPLDISDDILVAEEQEVERALGELDSEGWNVHRVFQRSSWYRLRYRIGRFREEILELSLRPLSPEVADQLRDISFRCTHAWTSMPAHLRYSPSRWDDSLSLAIRIMLLMSYLAYLYNIFLVQRLLAQHDPSAERALLDVSSKLLSAVLLLGRQHEPMIDIQRDFITTIVLYGFSSASVLIKALHTQVRTGQPTAYTGSRAELIRNLSVFISHIELMALPSTLNINHTLFKHASKMFTRILDEVLEYHPPAPTAAPGPSSAGANMEIGVSAGEEWNGSWAADGMEFLDTLDFGVVFDQWVF
ncbi:transcription factor domain-containing protein [Aspergillus lucknowensis]|uniref:Zn(2)-C6 fungal-type domain-containing protein n=1 Tax=Aspergillus lucknowensis TaxID=176173 RepID=A0ABR4LXX1_9EURO